MLESSCLALLAGKALPLHSVYVRYTPAVVALLPVADSMTVWIFVAGSAMLSVSISLNAMSTHGACTAIFVAVAAIGGFLVASIRTLGKVSSLAWIGMISILSASKSIFTHGELFHG